MSIVFRFEWLGSALARSCSIGSIFDCFVRIEAPRIGQELNVLELLQGECKARAGLRCLASWGALTDPTQVGAVKGLWRNPELGEKVRSEYAHRPDRVSQAAAHNHNFAGNVVLSRHPHK